MKAEPPDLQRQFRKEFVRQAPGPVLVIGSAIYEGRPNWRDWHPDGLGVDMLQGEGVDFVADLEIEPLSLVVSHIECVSVLEHVQRPWLMAGHIEKMLIDGGSFFLSVPWTWRFHGYPADYWRFSHLTLPILFPSIEWKDVRYGVNGKLTTSERMPKSQAGFLTKMELLGWGVKCAS